MKYALPIAIPLLAVAAVAGWARTPLMPSTPIHPIIDISGGYLLGGSSGGKWVRPSAVAPGLRKSQSVRLYGMSEPAGRGKTGKPLLETEPCDGTFFVEVTPKKGIMALGGNWNPLPRLPQNKSVTQPAYRTAVAEILKRNGISRPNVKITQIIQVDLDGDRQSETLISATNHTYNQGSPNPNSKAGDYSLVLVRKVVKGKVQTYILDSQYHPKAKTFNAPYLFTIASVLDLNGDGKLEVLVHGRHYEANWTDVYEMRGPTAKKVLSAGCGN